MSSPYRGVRQQTYNIEDDKLKLIQRFPASLQAAHWHRQANKFGLASNQDIRVCPCCEERVNNTSFSCRKKATDEALPASVSLFFLFIKMTIIYLTLRFIIADGFNLFSNWRGGDCGSLKGPLTYICEPTLAMVSSIGNKFTDYPTLRRVDFLNMIAIIASCAFFAIYRFIQFKEYIRHDLSDQTQDDFSLYIRNIPIAMNDPTACNYEERLSMVFTQIIMQFIAKGQAGQLNNPLWTSYVDVSNRPHNIQAIQMTDKSTNPAFLNEFITSIDLCWDTERILNVINLRQQLKNQKEGIVAQLQKNQQNPQQNMRGSMGQGQVSGDIRGSMGQTGQNMYQSGYGQGQNNYQALNQSYGQQGQQGPSEAQQMQMMLQKTDHELKLTRDAYLDMCARMSIRQTQPFDFAMSHFVGKAFVSFQYQHYAYAIVQYTSENPIYLDGRKLEILPATNPRDVNWDNMGIDEQNKSTRKVISFFITLGLLIIIFCILAFLDHFQNAGSQGGGEPQGPPPKEPQQKPSFFKRILQMGVGTLLMFGISIFSNSVNSFLESVLPKVTEYEKHETKTYYQLSFMLKLLISQFINSVLMFFILSLVFPMPMWSPAGLLPQMANMFVVSALMMSLMSLVSPGHLFQCIRNRRNYSGKDRFPVHQQRLNRQFQLPPFDLASRYTHYILQTYTVSFYAYVLPFGTLIMILLFSVEYLIDKMNLFCRTSLKDDFNFDMTRVATKLFESSVFVFALGNLIFSWQIQRHVSTYAVIGLVVATLFMVYLWLLPSRIENILVANLVRFEQFSYDYCKIMNRFEHTYRNQNPASRLSSLTAVKKMENWALLPEDLQMLQNARR